MMEVSERANLKVKYKYILKANFKIIYNRVQPTGERLKGEKSCSSDRIKGSNLPAWYPQLFTAERETESAERRRFAMMAVQGSDVLWIRWCFSLVFFVITVAGTENGMFVYSTRNCLR